MTCVPAASPSRHLRWQSEVCILSAPSRAGLMERARRLQDYLRADPEVPLKDLAYTLNVPLADGSLRLAIVASSAEDLGKVIGRGGRVIKAIRILARAAATRSGKRVTVEIVRP